MVSNLVSPGIDLSAIVLIQSVWRGALARCRVAAMKDDGARGAKMRLRQALREMELAIGRHKLKFDDNAYHAGQI